MGERGQFDAIVAGAGIWGCTMARRLAEAGRRVLVLEKRAAIGGNCRCKTVDGIEVHLYGSHIFHTSNEEVWAFVRRFAEFNDYRHVVLARTKKVGGESRWTAEGAHLYHLPIGCTLLKEFFGREIKPSEMTDDERRQLFDAFIRGYTSKQWGVAPEKVDPSIIARLKVRDNYSTDYFDDPHQGIPSEGYNKMFERMLDHPNITVQCNCELIVAADVSDASAIERGLVGADHRAARYVFSARGEGAEEINKLLCPPTFSTYSLPIYYSGPIDALFNYTFGHLPWRTLNFERETLNCPDYQGNSVVNYTDADVPFTRIHEFKHYHPEWGASSKTVIMREYSATWQPGDEPYYPIDNAESRALLAKYLSEVEKLNHHCSTSNLQPSTSLTIGGRLGAYKYYDMDKSVAAALEQKLL